MSIYNPYSVVFMQLRNFENTQKETFCAKKRNMAFQQNFVII